MIEYYPKPKALGTSGLASLLLGPIAIEEKIDGSQFQFRESVVGGEIVRECQSRTQGVPLGAVGMFSRAAFHVEAMNLTRGYTYRAEYLSKPKHNVLAYDRVPHKNIMLFDVQGPDGVFLTRAAKELEAARLGCECVPLLFEGRWPLGKTFDGFMELESVLGGCAIEGIVIKNYATNPPLFGKVVSAKFKEIAGGKIKAPRESVVESLLTQLRTEARWQKAVQHLTEDGVLVGEMRDIGLLVKEIQDDTLDESKDEILAALYEWISPQIRKGVVSGFSQWYAGVLAECRS